MAINVTCCLLLSNSFEWMLALVGMVSNQVFTIGFNEFKMIDAILLLIAINGMIPFNKY